MCSDISIIRIHLGISGQVKICFFLILMAYWAGFRIFQQNQENPNKIGVVGQSDITSVE